MGISQETVERQQTQRYQNIEAVRKEAVARVPAHARHAVDTLSRMVGNSTKTLIKGLTFTRDLLAMAQKGLPSASKYLQLEEMRNATKIQHLHDADKIVSGFKKLGKQQRDQVNAYIKKSTMSAKWGYTPDHFNAQDAQNLKIDPEMRAGFNSLNKEQQKVVQDVFRHGHTTLATLKTLVNLNVAEEFNHGIAAAKAAGDEKTAAKLEADKADQLKHFQSLLKIGEYNPYAPLKRFGNHVVIGKSAWLLETEARAKENPNDTKLQTQLREMKQS